MTDYIERDSVLTELRTELERLETEEARLRQRLEEVTAEKGALARIVSRFRRPAASPTARNRRTVVPVSVAELVGKTIEEAAVHIAARSGGIFKFTAARRVMVEAGLVADGNSGSTALYHVMSESTQFRKGSMRGEYELIVLSEDDVDEPETEQKLSD